MHGDDENESESENASENANHGNVDVAILSNEIVPLLPASPSYHLDLVLSFGVPLLSDSSLPRPVREHEAELSLNSPSSPSHLWDFQGE